MHTFPPLSKEEISEQAGSPQRGSEYPASCAIVRLEAEVIYDIDKIDLFIHKGPLRSPGEERRGREDAAMDDQLCQHLAQYSALYGLSMKLL